MNYSDLLYGPNFRVLGVSANLTVNETFGAVDLTVIDKTAGIPASDPEFSRFSDVLGAGVHIIKPACVMMMSELNALGVPIGELDGSIITFNSKTWRIESHAYLPSPGGEADGQLLIYLIEGAD